ncbi:MAG: ferrous iron transport protein B [Methanobacteriota archaeon]|nr:MAG: ferrous iron transport protein B [Euryarchaeota archaeon]
MEIALAGNPNVGKSVIFGKLTGVGIISANYPGTTVEYAEGTAKLGEMIVNVIDLPGTYSLSGNTDDERVATDLLRSRKPDAVVAVVDASRLERSLVLLFELIESGHKVVAALNMHDIALKNGLAIDFEALEQTLMIPVIPTVAIRGEGIDALLDAAVKLRPRSRFSVRYDSHTEDVISRLAGMLREEDWQLPLRAVAIRILMADKGILERVDGDIKDTAESLAEEFERQHGESVIVHIQRDRFGEAGRIANDAVRQMETAEIRRSRISDITIRPLTGVPILALVLATIFLVLVFGGGLIEGALVGSYEGLAKGFFDDLKAGTDSQMAQGALEGVYISIEAMLAIVIPYILVFYIMLSILEDTGYLVRVVSLLDGVMHRIGLHGRAIISMVVGYGCNVPAILATRTIGSRRERLILAILITLAVPCSAQTAIIIGTVGNYAGPEWALLIFAILISLLVVFGFVLHRIMRFEPTHLFLEIPELRWPSVGQTLGKTGVRIGEFLTIAFPLLLAGSIVLEILMVEGVLDKLVEPSEPFMVGVLGLPAVTVVALVFGVLRKEMALQMLMVLFGTSNLALALTNEQMFVFALVMAIFMPCLAALAVITREFGLKNMAVITASSIFLALVFGAVANLILAI